MSGYVRNIEINVKFDGQDVKVVLKPMLRADLFKLRGLLPQNATGLKIGDKDAYPAFEFYASRLHDYVIESNVTDAAGTKVEAQEWIDSSYFVNLLTQVMTQHMAKANPSSPLLSAAQPGESSN